jgi:hypothetical protein
MPYAPQGSNHKVWQTDNKNSKGNSTSTVKVEAVGSSETDRRPHDLKT